MGGGKRKEKRQEKDKVGGKVKREKMGNERIKKVTEKIQGITPERIF